MAPHVATSSYWTDNTTAPKFSAFKEDIELGSWLQLLLAFDVIMLVVGAGITGVTASYLLKRAGVSVALVERNRCVEGETAYTTAHLTPVIDTRLKDLRKLRLRRLRRRRAVR